MNISSHWYERVWIEGKFEDTWIGTTDGEAMLSWYYCGIIDQKKGMSKSWLDIHHSSLQNSQFLK